MNNFIIVRVERIPAGDIPVGEKRNEPIIGPIADSRPNITTAQSYAKECAIQNPQFDYAIFEMKELMRIDEPRTVTIRPNN